MAKDKVLSENMIKTILKSPSWREYSEVLDLLFQDVQLSSYNFFNDNYALNNYLNLGKIKYLENRGMDFSAVYKFNSHTDFQYEAPLPVWIFFLITSKLKDKLSIDRYSTLYYGENIKQLFQREGVLDGQVIPLKDTYNKTHNPQNMNKPVILAFEYILKQDEQGLAGAFSYLIQNESIFKKHFKNYQSLIIKNIFDYTKTLNKKDLENCLPQIRKTEELMDIKLNFESLISSLKISSSSFTLINCFKEHDFISQECANQSNQQLALKMYKAFLKDNTSRLHANIKNHASNVSVSSVQEDAILMAGFEEKWQDFLDSSDYEEIRKNINNVDSFKQLYWSDVKQLFNSPTAIDDYMEELSTDEFKKVQERVNILIEKNILKSEVDTSQSYKKLTL